MARSYVDRKSFTSWFYKSSSIRNVAQFYLWAFPSNTGNCHPPEVQDLEFLIVGQCSLQVVLLDLNGKLITCLGLVLFVLVFSFSENLLQAKVCNNF